MASVPNEMNEGWIFYPLRDRLKRAFRDVAHRNKRILLMWYPNRMQIIFSAVQCLFKSTFKTSSMAILYGAKSGCLFSGGEEAGNGNQPIWGWPSW